jgi:hypothetical protein
MSLSERRVFSLYSSRVRISCNPFPCAVITRPLNMVNSGMSHVVHFTIPKELVLRLIFTADDSATLQQTNFNNSSTVILNFPRIRSAIFHLPPKIHSNTSKHSSTQYVLPS